MKKSFRENEIATNKIIAFVSMAFVVICIFDYFSLKLYYSEGLDIATKYVFLPFSLVQIIIVAISAYYKFEKPWIKYLLLGETILTCTMSFMLFTTNASYFLLIPIVIAPRYFDRKLSIYVQIIQFTLFILACIWNLVFDGVSPFVVILHEAAAYNSWANIIDAVNYIIIPIGIALIFICVYCNSVTASGLQLIKKESEFSRITSTFENEFKMAAEIQQASLPAPYFETPDGNYVISACQVAAKEVCGDAYDYFMINSHTLCFIVADVAGKGLSAAMFMMSSRKAVQCAINCSSNFTQAVELANKLICADNPKEMFITFWLGIIDTESGIGQFSNAGHPLPIIKHSNGSYEIIQTEPDLFVGNFPEYPPKTYKLYMNKGDVLFLYTDGVTDARNSKDEMFGMDGVINTIKACENTAVAFTDSMSKTIDEFISKTDQYDDITMMAVQCNKVIEAKTLSITFESNMEGTRNAINAVDEILKSISCPDDQRRNIDVVVDEICTNISDYAYDGDGLIYLDITFGHNYADLVFKDDGVPFDPLEKNDPEMTDDPQIGGWGIYLSRKLSNDISYKYINNQNVLTIGFLWNIL